MYYGISNLVFFMNFNYLWWPSHGLNFLLSSRSCNETGKMFRNFSQFILKCIRNSLSTCVVHFLIHFVICRRISFFNEYMPEKVWYSSMCIFEHLLCLRSYQLNSEKPLIKLIFTFYHDTHSWLFGTEITCYEGILWLCLISWFLAFA